MEEKEGDNVGYRRKRKEGNYRLRNGLNHGSIKVRRTRMFRFSGLQYRAGANAELGYACPLQKQGKVWPRSDRGTVSLGCFAAEGADNTKPFWMRFLLMLAAFRGSCSVAGTVPRQDIQYGSNTMQKLAVRPMSAARSSNRIGKASPSIAPNTAKHI